MGVEVSIRGEKVNDFSPSVAFQYLSALHLDFHAASAWAESEGWGVLMISSAKEAMVQTAGHRSWQEGRWA